MATKKPETKKKAKTASKARGTKATKKNPKIPKIESKTINGLANQPTDRKAWERRENETQKAWEAFQVFLTEGKRSTTETAKLLGKSTTLMVRWQQKYEWNVRVKAYDNEVQEGAIEKAKETMERDLVGVFTRLYDSALVLIQKADEASKNIVPADMSPRDIQGFYRVATEMIEVFNTGTSAKAEEEDIEENDVQIYVPDNGRLTDEAEVM